MTVLPFKLLTAAQYLATTTTIDFQGRVIAQADPRLGALSPPIQNIKYK
jgi:hypothetical protein